MPELPSNRIPPNTSRSVPRSAVQAMRQAVNSAPLPPGELPGCFKAVCVLGLVLCACVWILSFGVQSSRRGQMAAQPAGTLSEQGRATPEPVPAPVRAAVPPSKPNRPRNSLNLAFPSQGTPFSPSAEVTRLPSPIVLPATPAVPRAAPSTQRPSLWLCDMSHLRNLRVEGRVVADYEVGRFCHDLVLRQAREAGIPLGSGPGAGVLKVEWVSCSSRQVQSFPDAWLARVTLRATWHDAAGNARRTELIEGRGSRPLSWAGSLQSAADAAAAQAIERLQRAL